MLKYFTMKAKNKSEIKEDRSIPDEDKTILSKEKYKMIGRVDIPGIDAIKKVFLQKKNIIINGIINPNEWS